MLSQEQYELLAWLRDQGRPVSMREMERRQAPGFTAQRVEQMRTDGLIDRSMGFEDGEIVGVYTVSDKGRAALEAREDSRQREQQQAQQMAQQTAEQQAAHERERQEDLVLAAKARRANVWAAIIGAVVGVVLTLLVEHFDAITAWVLSLFS